MSEAFFKRLFWVFSLMSVGIILGIIAFSTTVEIKDLDLWLHLRMGDWILQNRMVPSVDVLSASFLGQPWMNHEWLFQILLAGTKSAFGMDGLIILQMCVVMTTFFVAFLMVHDENRYLVVAPLFYLMFLVYQTRFTIRPDIFSVFFLVILLFVLSRYLNRAWSLAFVFILQVVWGNMHGFALWGPVIVGLGWLAEAMKRKCPLPYSWSEEGRLQDHEFRRLGWMFGVMVLAMFINPQGVEGAWYPLKTLLGMGGSNQVFFENITELQRSLTFSTLFDVHKSMPFKALIVVSGLSFIMNRRRIDIGALMLWIVFLLFSLSAVRNMVYFAFIAFFATMLNVSRMRILDYFPLSFRGVRVMYVAGALVSFVLILNFTGYAARVSQLGYYDFQRYERKSEFLGIDQRTFPHEAADFLLEHEITGNFFNNFNVGAYLVGRLFPQIMVYIDGRTELRGADFFKKYQKIWDEGDTIAFDEEVEKYQLTGVFLGISASNLPQELLKNLYTSADWKVVYFDYDALIFLRDVPQNKAWIDQLEMDLTQWQSIELDVFRLQDASVWPYQNIIRAQVLFDLEFLDQALLEIEAALRIAPHYVKARAMKGAILRKREKYDQAFQEFRLAAALDVTYRYHLSRAYLDVGRYDEGMSLAQQALNEEVGSTKYSFLIIKGLMKKKEFKQGCGILLQVLGEHQESCGLAVSLAERLLKEGDLQAVRQILDVMQSFPDKFDTEKLKTRLREVRETLENVGGNNG